MAAEAASASSAHDRATVVRHTVAWLIAHPPKEARPPWWELQRTVRYALLTDCKSLADHCGKASSTLTEKRVGLDIADVREAVEAGDELLWVPTETMVAGGLATHLPKEKIA